LNFLIKNEDLRKKWSDNARNAAIKYFDRKKIALDLLELLKNL
jgi:glycosyltransferase involved in cell wall biosynthesis